MLRLSRKALLALEAVLDVACHARPDPVQAREIAERQSVPHRHLEQVMQALVRAGILRGVRGPHGGYRLARERRRITLAAIIAAADGLEQAPSRHAFSQLGAQCLAPLCQKLEAGAAQELSRLTLADICARSPEPPPQGVGREAGQGAQGAGAQSRAADQPRSRSTPSPDFTI